MDRVEKIPLKRVYLMNLFLLQNMESVFRLRKIRVEKYGAKTEYVYVISLVKNIPYSAEASVKLFYDICLKMLEDGECLSTVDRCFKIESKDFTVRYYLELWRKCADRIAYVEDGCVKMELLHRMSCEQASSIFKKYRVDPLELMCECESSASAENDVDRYVALAKALRRKEESE